MDASGPTAPIKHMPSQQDDDAEPKPSTLPSRPADRILRVGAGFRCRLIVGAIRGYCLTLRRLHFRFGLSKVALKGRARQQFTDKGLTQYAPGIDVRWEMSAEEDPVPA